MRKGKLIRMQVPPSASSSAARVLSVSPGYQAYFRLEWLPFSLQTSFPIFNTICDMAIFLEMYSVCDMNNFFITIQGENISTNVTNKSTKYNRIINNSSIYDNFINSRY